MRIALRYLDDEEVLDLRKVAENKGKAKRKCEVNVEDKKRKSKKGK